MIWLFKMDEVFWGNKPKVNEHYLFDTNDIEFDINRYDISLYFALANYFILSDSNDKEIYELRFTGDNINPNRKLVSAESPYHSIIREYYISMSRDNKLNEMGI